MSREAALTALLDAQDGPLPLTQLCHLCRGGIPEASPALRPRCWRVLIALINVKDTPAQGQAQLEKARGSYQRIVTGLMESLDTDQETNRGETLNTLDQALLGSAHDVQRTATNLSFFSTAIRSPNPMLDVPHSRDMFERLWKLRTYTKSSHRRINRYSTGSTSSIGSNEGSDELYWEALHRILFVYSTCNPLGYVQGMNEVVAVLLFIFAHDPTTDGLYAEADTFNAFSLLMGNGLSDLYSMYHDGNFEPSTATAQATGLGSTLNHFWRRLKLIDPELWRHLDDLEVEPSFFLVKWITTLFAQTFEYASLATVWDFLLSGMNAAPSISSPFPPLIESLVDMSLAMVISIKDRLLGGAFPLCLSLLQNFDIELDLGTLLAHALSIQARRLAGDLEEEAPAKKLTLKERLAAAAAATSPKLSSINQEAASINAKLSRSINSSSEAFAQSDAAASLARFGSNLNASMISWKSSAPSTIAKLQDTVLNVRETAQAAVRRPVSPAFDQPFVPPSDSPPGPAPKPLILSPTSSVISERAGSPASSRRESLSSNASTSTPTLKSNNVLAVSPLGSPLRSPGHSSIRYNPSPTHLRSSSSSYAQRIGHSLEDVPLSRRRQSSEPISPNRSPVALPPLKEAAAIVDWSSFGMRSKTPDATPLPEEADEVLEILSTPPRKSSRPRPDSVDSLAKSLPASLHLASPPPRKQSISTPADAVLNGVIEGPTSPRASPTAARLPRKKFTSSRRRRQGSLSESISSQSDEPNGNRQPGKEGGDGLEDYAAVVEAYS